MHPAAGPVQSTKGWKYKDYATLAHRPGLRVIPHGRFCCSSTVNRAIRLMRLTAMRHMPVTPVCDSLREVDETNGT